MPASIVARVVRMPVLAAVAAMALAACSNDPMSPVAQQANLRNSVNVAPAGVGADTKPADTSVPWYRNGGASTSEKPADTSVPWYRNSIDTTPTKAADTSVPWY